MSRQVHLVGSIRLENTEAVFRALSEHLGSRAPRYPDGETGERHYWIIWQSGIFEAHPGFEEQTEQAPSGRPFKLFNLVEGGDPQALAFGALGYAAAAIESYKQFVRLRTEGVIPKGTRFMVALPTPAAVVNFFIVPEQVETVIKPYEIAMARERDEILEAIPSEDLAIQWDVMREIIAYDGGPITVSYTDVFHGTVTRLRELCAPIPAAVEVGFHLCYGDPGHRHIIEPVDLKTSVKFANGIAEALGRRVDWMHMAVPRDRSDDAYFAPLDQLELPKETTLVLGLVHYNDGVEGTRQRMATAERFRSDFAIATECGFGRRDPSTILELLDIHAIVADG